MSEDEAKNGLLSNDEVPKPVLESVRLSEEFGILRLPDIDGSPIYFPSFRVAKGGGRYMSGRHDVLRDIAREDALVVNQLSDNQKGRLSYALNDLKLPVILAVHVALNTDKDLTTFSKPGKDVENPVSLALIGRAAVGKSFMAVMLSMREGYEILNFDSVSKDNSEAFKNFLVEKLGEDKIKGLTIKEVREMQNRFIAQIGDNTGIEPKTFREMLDAALEKVLSSPDRAGLYICDWPGQPGLVDFGGERVRGRIRKHHVIDLAARESCEGQVLSTHQLNVDTMQTKLDWIKKVIDDNLDEWRLRNTEYVNATKRAAVS